MTSRRRVALGTPRADLVGFPSVIGPQVVFRAHGADRGPWWFSSSGAGRFDLADPEGTCYVASDAAAALRERLGPTLASLGFVRTSDVDGVVVSTLRPPEGPALADVVAESAVLFGVTREISTTVDYAVTQAWAAGFFAASFGGVRYQPRFSTAAGTLSFALFGPSGALDLPPGTAVAARTVARESGMPVWAPPGMGELHVVSPPAR